MELEKKTNQLEELKIKIIKTMEKPCWTQRQVDNIRQGYRWIEG
jgi:hypothetical protein